MSLKMKMMKKLHLPIAQNADGVMMKLITSIKIVLSADGTQKKKRGVKKENRQTKIS